MGNSPPNGPYAGGRAYQRTPLFPFPLPLPTESSLVSGLQASRASASAPVLSPSCPSSPQCICEVYRASSGSASPRERRSRSRPRHRSYGDADGMRARRGHGGQEEKARKPRQAKKRNAAASSVSSSMSSRDSSSMALAGRLNMKSASSRNRARHRNEPRHRNNKKSAGRRGEEKSTRVRDMTASPRERERVSRHSARGSYSSGGKNERRDRAKGVGRGDTADRRGKGNSSNKHKRDQRGHLESNESHDRRPKSRERHARPRHHRGRGSTAHAATNTIANAGGGGSPQRRDQTDVRQDDRVHKQLRTFQPTRNDTSTSLVINENIRTDVAKQLKNKMMQQKKEEKKEAGGFGLDDLMLRRGAAHGALQAGGPTKGYGHAAQPPGAYAHSNMVQSVQSMQYSSPVETIECGQLVQTAQGERVVSPRRRGHSAQRSRRNDNGERWPHPVTAGAQRQPKGFL